MFFFNLASLVLNGQVYKAFSLVDLKHLTPILYIGGNSNSQLTNSGFKGAISHLIVNGFQVDLFLDTILKSSINLWNTCIVNKCKNNGVCINEQNSVGYRCYCKENFHGTHCENLKSKKFKSKNLIFILKYF